MLSDNQGPINWDALLDSLSWKDAAASDEIVQQQLRQRAAQYAAPAQAADDRQQDAFDLLVFRLSHEHYAVNVMTVRSVRSLGRVTRVPGTPRFFRGVVNVRGQVITVLDLRLFFDMPVDDETHPPHELIVVESNRLEIGLLADNVEGVQSIPKAQVDTAENMRYAFGVTTNRLVVLDIERLFEDERLIVGSKDDTSLE